MTGEHLIETITHCLQRANSALTLATDIRVALQGYLWRPTYRSNDFTI